MAWERWDRLPESRKQEVRQKLTPTLKPIKSDPGITIAALSRADQDQFIRKQIEEKARQNEALGRIVGEYYQKIGEVMSQPLVGTFEQYLASVRELKTLLVSKLQDLLQEQKETNRLLAQLTSMLSSAATQINTKPAASSVAPSPEPTTTPTGKTKAKTLPGLATRSRVDEARREWLLNTPWDQFPNWRKWRSEIEILFERLMEEQASKADLSSSWLRAYTHNVLSYQNIDSAITWVTAKELWQGYRQH